MKYWIQQKYCQCVGREERINQKNIKADLTHIHKIMSAYYANEKLC